MLDEKRIRQMTKTGFFSKKNEEKKCLTNSDRYFRSDYSENELTEKFFSGFHRISFWYLRCSLISY